MSVQSASFSETCPLCQLMDAENLPQDKSVPDEVLNGPDAKVARLSLREKFPWITVIDQKNWEQNFDLKTHKLSFPKEDSSEALIAAVSELMGPLSFLWDRFNYYMGYPRVTAITIPKGVLYLHRSCSVPMRGWKYLNLLIALGNRYIDLEEKSYTLLYSEKTAAKIQMKIQNFFVEKGFEKVIYELLSEADAVVIHYEEPRKTDYILYKEMYQLGLRTNRIVSEDGWEEDYR